MTPFLECKSPKTEETEDLSAYPDRLEEWYIGKIVFITGGTGFMGKVLVEKLLRCCSGVKKIYLLMRTKKNKEPKERLQEIFSNPLFDLLKKTHGEEILDKVEPIPGDVTELALGISPENRQKIIDEVEIVFNCAATIRFDEVLRKAVLLNVRGTKYMLDLAKECRKLLVFCHVSTAYCHLNERILYEKAYPPPADPRHVMSICEWFNDNTIESIKNIILGTHPNSYSFTKALGESLVVDQLDNLPICILRPSVVIPIWRQPLPGWTDNINGPTGLLIGAGKGVIRTMYCKGDTYADFLPVDIAVNALVISTYDYVFHGTRRIYNVTSSAEHKLSWEEIIELGRNIIETEMPLNGIMWYPGGSMKRSRTLHNLAFFFFQLLPALFLDGILFLLGYDMILMRVQRRIRKGYEVLEYYVNNQWDFNNDASREARSLMNSKEKEVWKVDGEGMNYRDYFTDCVHAARLYILKETDDMLPAAKRSMKVMWLVDKTCKTLIITIFFYYVIWKIIGVSILGL